MAGKQIARLVRCPISEIERRAVLECMTDGMQNVGLDPERIAGLAGPDADTRGRTRRFVGAAFGHDRPLRVRVRGIGTGNPAQHEALAPLGVALVEHDAIGQFFHGIAIEVDLEFVETFGVIARCRHIAGNRMADVDDEHRARLAAEAVKIGDVEAYILTGERGVEVVGHESILSEVSLRVVLPARQPRAFSVEWIVERRVRGGCPERIGIADLHCAVGIGSAHSARRLGCRRVGGVLLSGRPARCRGAARERKRSSGR